MFGLGWGEMMLVGVVALIVVGPKDLPVMFRTLGRFTGKAKSMAREFSSAMNEAADGAGVKDIAKDLNTMTSSKSLGLDRLEEAASKFEKWDPTADAEKHHTSQKAMGSNTAKLAQKRAEAARKIQQKTAESVAERRANEARDALAVAEADLARAKASAPKAETKKPATKKAASKKPAPKKPAAKKPATNTASKKTAKAPKANKA